MRGGIHGSICLCVCERVYVCVCVYACMDGWIDDDGCHGLGFLLGGGWSPGLTFVDALHDVISTHGGELVHKAPVYSMYKNENSVAEVEV